MSKQLFVVLGLASNASVMSCEPSELSCLFNLTYTWVVSSLTCMGISGSLITSCNLQGLEEYSQHCKGG